MQYETEQDATASLLADSFAPDGDFTWRRALGKRGSYQWATIEQTAIGRFKVVKRNVFA